MEFRGDYRFYSKNFQTHHIIPWDKAGICNHSALTAAGFDPETERSNFKPLPTNDAMHNKDKDFANQSTIHKGGHTNAYYNTIRNELNRINDLGNSLGWSQSEYRAAVDDLVGVIKYGLREGMIALNKNARDGAEPLSADLLERIEETRTQENLQAEANIARREAQALADAAHNPSFEETIQTAHLEDTYNSTNPNQAIAKQGASSSEIGGVGIQAGLIQGIHHGLQDLINPNHVFLMPIENGEMPFTQPQLQQIIRELAIGIFVHDKKPMFSLHFNQDGSLFPVLGPEYEHTLVGYTMGMLDYIMKGFLNGAIFKEEFIKSWNERPNKDTSNDLNQLIDFKQHIAFHGVRGLPYRSVRECLHALGAAQNEDFDATFSTSFRIIADSPIRKAKDGFMIGTDFRVEYTIEGTPAFNSWLQRYQKEHGKPPPILRPIQSEFRNLGYI